VIGLNHVGFISMELSC